MRTDLARAWDVFRHEGVTSFLRKAAKAVSDRLLAGAPDEVGIILHAFKGSLGPRTMIDVGAATGTTLSPFAEQGWRVFAFEPDARNRQKLERILGRDPNVAIDPRALSDEAARDVPFFSSSESIGLSSLTPFHPTHRPSGKVDVTTLSIFTREVGLAGIDFLKVDTEGHDLRVLKGIPWSELRPRVIMVEFDDAKTVAMGYAWNDMAQYLVERGYHVLVSEWQLLERYGAGHAWQSASEFPCGLGSPNAWGNLICTPDSKVYERVLLGFHTFEGRNRRWATVRRLLDRVVSL